MTPEEFRLWGHRLINWLADYQQQVERYPVRSVLKPGEFRAGLPAHAPESGESFQAILDDLNSKILPGITHWQSPNFFAYFPSNASGFSVLGELVAAGLSVQGMLWETSPACTELETHVLDWLVELLGLPARFRSDSLGGGVIQDSASSALLCALIAARERCTDSNSRLQGNDNRLVLYASSEAHSSLEKAAVIAGIGLNQVRRIAVDEAHALRVDELQRVLVVDRAAGLIPFMVVATLGTTSSLACDPLPAIGSLCQQEKLWLHVDAAMAGSAALCPEYRYIHEGLDGADSYCFNPHKWLLTNFDCDCFYVADRAALTRALAVTPAYLDNPASESGTVIDYRDWQIPLGRRFRALKLWFVLRGFGAEGLRQNIRHGIALAQSWGETIQAHPDFELACPVAFNLICFRHRLGDAFNQQLESALNNSGKIYLSHTLLDGRYTLRLCVGQSTVKTHHIDAAWALIVGTASALSDAL
jgi:aromatic-L-amino-acid decarboxylase